MGFLRSFFGGNFVEIFNENGMRGYRHNGKEYIHHTELHPRHTAFYRLSLTQKIGLIILGIVLVVGLFISWKTTVIGVIAALTILYFLDLLFDLYLVLKSFSKSPEIDVSREEIDFLDDSQLPTYTVFCPLYKEWSVLPQFVKAMGGLDYPKEKLQIMLLLEEDDEKTISEARKMALPRNFTIEIIPNSKPKTKPKALNYGLLRATGEYIVIYDAEDIPEADQLKKVVVAFQRLGSQTKCIQAKLNFYNPSQNLLTRVFTAEYSLWFDLILTGLQSIHAPIPLGGTSNHFRTADIQKLKGWDAFNVTEDADLGIRIAKRGYRTAIVNSTTHEEANSSVPNWFLQRTRWIKGYMQTYLVHMRRPSDFTSHGQLLHFFTFQFVVGGKITSMLINPLMWIMTILYFASTATFGSTIQSLFPPQIFYMGLFSFIFGNFLYLYYYMMGCAKRGQYSLIKYVFLVPLYWLAMSMASYVALYNLIKQPYYWSKTKHGLHIANSTQSKAPGFQFS
jgi:cellulose synthase/poly-beta-1,6-N-acetylglucosamine synthase-like glycosyltransferase